MPKYPIHPVQPYGQGNAMYWHNAYRNYAKYFPNMFNKGYAHFTRTVNIHNSRFPNDPWPKWNYPDWLKWANYHSRQRRQQILQNKQKSANKFNQNFYHYIINKYGAWPSFKNPRYLALANRNSMAKGLPTVDIKKEKEQYLTNKMNAIYYKLKNRMSNKK